MTDTTAGATRQAEICPECGTPMELVEQNETTGTAGTDVVFRCANGHERRYHRDTPSAPPHARDTISDAPSDPASDHG